MTGARTLTEAKPGELSLSVAALPRRWLDPRKATDRVVRVALPVALACVLGAGCGADDEQSESERLTRAAELLDSATLAAGLSARSEDYVLRCSEQGIDDSAESAFVSRMFELGDTEAEVLSEALEAFFRQRGFRPVARRWGYTGLQKDGLIAGIVIDAEAGELELVVDVGLCDGASSGWRDG